MNPNMRKSVQIQLQNERTILLFDDKKRSTKNEMKWKMIYEMQKMNE